MRPGLSITKGAVETGRFVVPYRVYEGEGPHILCLNGVQQSMAMWYDFVCHYSPPYRITLFDFPGQGKGKILSGPMLVSLDEQVDILHEVLKTTNTNDVTICAASWGGIVAVAYAARYQDSLKKLCLAGMGTRANAKMLETIRKGCATNPNDRQKMAEVLLESFGQELPEKIKKKIVLQFQTMKEDNLKAFYEQGSFVMSTQRIGNLIDLSSIRAETILIHGEKDTIIDLDDVHFLASQIPHCEVRIIKGAGHFMHLEQDLFSAYEDILPIPPAAVPQNL